MKNHELIFEKIKTLLKKYFKDELILSKDGYQINIGDSGIWMLCDVREITIGFGMNHQHYNEDYQGIHEAMEHFFDLIGRRKRVTEYFKGNSCFRCETEVELGEGEYYSIGTTELLFYPYWKKTEKKVYFENALIDYSIIKDEVEEIKSLIK